MSDYTEYVDYLDNEDFNKPRVSPMPGQAVRVVDIWSNTYNEYREELEESEVARAQIITSEVRKHRADDPTYQEELVKYPEYVSKETSGHAWYPGTHKPVLDIDMPVKAIPSSTEGHFHLYIDKEMSWDNYVKLMKVMAEVGILEEGYVNASISREYSACRLPWVKKGETIQTGKKDTRKDEWF